MALGDVIEAVERSERTLTVFNPDDEVAAERDDGFYGIWTYDPETVEWIHALLAERHDPRRSRS